LALLSFALLAKEIAVHVESHLEINRKEKAAEALGWHG